MSRIKQLPLDLNLESTRNFSNYIFSGNEELVSVLKEMAQGRGPQELYIAGERCSGKSHLLKACCHEASVRAMFLPMAQAMLQGPEIFEGLENLELVCLDDIHLMAAQPRWEEAFFHLFNRLREKKVRLIMSATDTAQAVGFALPDLLSRLTWAAVYHIQPLEDSGKLSLLQKRAQDQGLEFAPEVAEFLIKRSARDMHYLLSMMDRLDRASLAAQRRLTIPFVKEVLELS